MGTIKVLGLGEVKFTPDVIRVKVLIEQVYASYPQAFNAGVSNTNKIKDILPPIGFDRDLVKTAMFEINKHHERERIGKDDYKWVHRGYAIKQRFTIDIEMGDPKLSALLCRIGEEMLGVETELSFALSDIEGARQKLVEAAVKDALSKAEAMAAVLGKQLGEIKSLNYGVPEEHRYAKRHAYGLSEIACGSAEKMDFTPNNLEGSANVEAIWELL